MDLRSRPSVLQLYLSEARISRIWTLSFWAADDIYSQPAFSREGGIEPCHCVPSYMATSPPIMTVHSISMAEFIKNKTNRSHLLRKVHPKMIETKYISLTLVINMQTDYHISHELHRLHMCVCACVCETQEQVRRLILVIACSIRRKCQGTGHESQARSIQVAFRERNHTEVHETMFSPSSYSRPWWKEDRAEYLQLFITLNSLFWTHYFSSLVIQFRYQNHIG